LYTDPGGQCVASVGVVKAPFRIVDIDEELSLVFCRAIRCDIVCCTLVVVDMMMTVILVISKPVMLSHFIIDISLFQQSIHGARGATLPAEVVCCVVRWDGVTEVEVEPPREITARFTILYFISVYLTCLP
jgi:hypothetical protein